VNFMFGFKDARNNCYFRIGYDRKLEKRHLIGVDTLKKTYSAYKFSTGQNDIQLIDIYKRQVSDKLMTNSNTS